MFKNFKTYNDFMLEYEMAKNDLYSYNRCLNVLQRKNSYINCESGGGSYSAHLREKVQEVSNKLREYDELSNEIFKNQKTNFDMIELILSLINNEINIENRYSLRMVTVENTKMSEVRTKDSYSLKLDSKTGNDITSYILLVKNSFKKNRITEIFHNEKFDKYEKEGYIVELDKINGVIDNQTKLDSYLSQKTIDIDKIKGLKTIYIEVIKEKLFNEYKEKHSENKQIQKRKSITN